MQRKNIFSNKLWNCCHLEKYNFNRIVISVFWWSSSTIPYCVCVLFLKVWSTILFSNTYILHYCVFFSFVRSFIRSVLFNFLLALSLFSILLLFYSFSPSRFFFARQSAPDDCIVATAITHSYTSAVVLCMFHIHTRLLHWTTDMHLYMCIIYMCVGEIELSCTIWLLSEFEKERKRWRVR